MGQKMTQGDGILAASTEFGDPAGNGIVPIEFVGLDEAGDGDRRQWFA